MFIFVSHFYISNIFERFYIDGMDTTVDHIVSRKERTHRVWKKRATISLPLASLHYLVKCQKKNRNNLKHVMRLTMHT